MEKEKVAFPKLIMIGGSSGSLEALMNILPHLKKNLAIPVVIVLHRSNQSDNGLVELLASKTMLKVCEADEKDMLLPGSIYIAPPDYHLLIERDNSLSLDAGAKIHYSRPSIDVSLISGAQVYGAALIAILLSGANSDGAEGSACVEAAGGQVIVQDPGDAIVSHMPAHALMHTKNALVKKAFDIATYINAL